MKLAVLGCLHGNVPPKIKSALAKEKVDAILCLGDLCNADKLRALKFGNWDTMEIIEAAFDRKKYVKLVQESAKTMQEPLRYFAKLKIPVFMVYGNNDYLGSDLKKDKIEEKGLESRLPGNVKLLKDSVMKFNDIYVAGYPGYRNSKNPNKKSEKRMKKFISKIKHPQSTIILSHDVPYNVFDRVIWKKSPLFGRHVGEKLYNKYFREKYICLACAHMHEYQGMDVLNKTPVLVSGHAREGRFAIITIECQKIAKVKFYK
jgi:Icc-related predicted phosphoesterase